MMIDFIDELHEQIADAMVQDLQIHSLQFNRLGFELVCGATIVGGGSWSKENANALRDRQIVGTFNGIPMMFRATWQQDHPQFCIHATPKGFIYG